jgi:hypothetical protein
MTTEHLHLSRIPYIVLIDSLVHQCLTHGMKEKVCEIFMIWIYDVHGIAVVASSTTRETRRNVELRLMKQSLFPSTVDDLASVGLTLLEENHLLPVVVVTSINVTAGLNAETGTSTACWCTIDSWDIDVLASVELEGRLSAEYLKVKFCLRVGEGTQCAHLSRSCVQRYA